jgi:hypothetical protein
VARVEGARLKRRNFFGAAALAAVLALGVLGVTASAVEGLELNVLGLTFGVDRWPPAIKLPLVGRLGAERSL